MDIVIDNVRVEKITFGHLFFIINIFSDMKNYMVLSLFLIGAMSALLITSCEKDDDGGMENPEPELVFPNDCRMDNFIEFSDSQLDTSIRIYSYDIDGNVTEVQDFVNDSLSLIRKHDRDDLGRLIKLEFYYPENVPGGHYEYRYIDNTDIVSDYTVYWDNGSVYYSVYYTYQEGTNQILRDSIDYELFDVIYVHTYEYDDANNTQAVFTDKNGVYNGKTITSFNPEITYPFLRANNPLHYNYPSAIVSYESYDENDVLKENSSYTIAYDIDENNRMIHMTHNYQSGEITETIISYDCE